MNTFELQSPTEISEFWKSAKNFAFNLTRNSHDAEDLVQQAWFKVEKRYQNVSNKGILYRTIRNLFIDGKRREKVVQFEPIEEMNPGRHVTTPSTASKDVEIIFEILSENERQCLYMNMVEGYTAEEISAKIGIPRGTVLSHSYRARRKLQSTFGHEFEFNTSTNRKTA